MAEWKPGDRFVFKGFLFRVVGPLSGDPEGFLLVRSESNGLVSMAALSVLDDPGRVERLPVSSVSSGRWRPGDRFALSGERYTVVDSADPHPGAAFVADYGDVRVWGVRRESDGVRMLVASEFLKDALAVERLSK